MKMGNKHCKLLFAFDKLPHQDYIQAKPPINKIKTETKWQLWYVRLDYQLYNTITTAKKYIYCVPKISNNDPVFKACSTCLQAKQTKNASTGTTLKTTVLFQGFSIDFSFTGIRSKNLKRRRDYLGVHGEIYWLLITNYFSVHI